MGDTSKSLEEVVKGLSPDLQKEVQDFAEFLAEKQANRPRRKPRFDWAGALEHLRDKYTSVELQHKISDWRVGQE